MRLLGELSAGEAIEAYTRFRRLRCKPPVDLWRNSDQKPAAIAAASDRFGNCFLPLSHIRHHAGNHAPNAPKRRFGVSRERA